LEISPTSRAVVASRPHRRLLRQRQPNLRRAVGRKVISGYFSPEMSLALHMCARRAGVSLQALMAEAFNDVLRKHGEIRRGMTGGGGKGLFKETARCVLMHPMRQAGPTVAAKNSNPTKQTSPLIQGQQV
jgi:DNA-nicking Smr family endonuclease